MRHFTVSPRGDVDGDGFVQLADVIAVLQVIVGMAPTLSADADVDRNGKIGLPEAVYILQVVIAGLR